MYISEKDQVLKYLPAQLKENKEWYVLFYVVNPATNKLHLKKIKLNRVSSKTERRRLGRQLVHQINVKLAAGWNPFIEQEAAKSYHKLFDVFDTFIETKEKELRADSVRSYKSFVKMLKDYVEDIRKDKNMYIISFDQTFAINFMQHLYLNKKISERTYNNQVAFYKLLFNWCIQYKYSKINPFEGMSKKKEKQKKRILIDVDTKEKMKLYLEKNNPEYFVICMLAHYALLRPKEITYLKIKDVDILNQKIFISGKISKNGNDRYPTIPDIMVELLKNMKLNEYDKECYVFSEKFRPGKTKIDPRVIAKFWDKLRNEIGMPKEMQFYSLRDSGITKMFEDGIDPIHIRDQADHSSLEITNIYTKFAKNNISQEIKNKCKSF